MKHQSKFKSEQESQHLAAEHQAQQQSSAREFGSVEEMLRHDAANTQVPAGVASRLKQASSSFPAPKRSWWRRLFGGNP